ncbi:MAG: tetratricopeptide repeat protein [Candidatus Baltobacteraceae bacterium]
MTNLHRSLSGAVLATALVAGGALTSIAVAAPRAHPSPTPSGSPAPLPTASPEPPSIAIPRLQAKVKANPNDRDSLTDLASQYLQIGRADLALPLTQHLLQLGSKTAQTYYFDGVANQTLGRIKEATTDLEAASNLEPTNPQVLLTLTDLYLRTNRPGDAERVAKRATTFNAKDERSFLNYGVVLGQEKKYDEARIQLEAASKLDPKDPTPFIVEAKTYEDQNAAALAQAMYDRALSVDPKSQEAMLDKARLYATQHQTKEAIALYEQILPLLPDDKAKAQIVDEEAAVYASEKQPTEAETQLKRAIATYPSVPDAHLAYGEWFEANKRNSQAETQFLAAVGPNRDNTAALLRLGQFYGSQNQVRKAIDQFKRLSELEPNDPNVFGVLGQAYTYDRQWAAARDAYRHGFGLQRTPPLLAGIGASDYALHNYKEAGLIFDALDKQAGSYLKSNPQLLFIMGKTYAATNQKPKAKSAYSRFLALLKPGSSAASDVKKLIADLGKTDKPAPKRTAAPKHT